MEASNLSETEFKLMVTRILNGMKKDIEKIKYNQFEMKTTYLIHWKE